MADISMHEYTLLNALFGFKKKKKHNEKIQPIIKHFSKDNSIKKNNEQEQRTKALMTQNVL